MKHLHKIVTATFLAIAIANISNQRAIAQSLPYALQLEQKGRALYEAGQFNDAVKLWQEAESAFNAEGELLRQAMTLSNLSLAYQQSGNWTLAAKATETSLNLLQTTPQPANSSERLKILAQALEVQGRLQLATGKAEQSQKIWQQAADTYAKVGDQIGVTRSYINQAQALQALGLYRQSLNTLTEVSKTLQKQPDSPMKLACLRNLGNALRVVGDLNQSQQVLQESWQLAQRLQSPQEMSATLFTLGNTKRALYDEAKALNKRKSLGVATEALNLYQQAATSSTSPITRLQANLNQFSLLIDTNQWSNAQDLLPQIKSQLANLPPTRTTVYSLIELAQNLIEADVKIKEIFSSSKSQFLIERSEIAQMLAIAVQQAKHLGDKRAESYAIGYLGELYEVNQQWQNAQDLTEQALNIAQAINSPEIAYEWQWQLGRIMKARGDNQGAIATYTQAVNNLQSLRTDLVAINSNVQFSFRERVEPVYRELVSLLLISEPGSSPSQENLRLARNTIESLQLAELANFFKENCLKAKPVQIDQVDKSAAVIYPIILSDRLEVIISLPNAPLRHYTTQLPRNEVEQTLIQLRKTLLSPSNRNYLSLSQKVYDWLIRPAAADLEKAQVKTLVFVLDGYLGNLPMAVLHDGNQFLVEKYGLALTPGLQLLDPQPLTRHPLKALTAGLTEARQQFPALPYVEEELASIKTELPSQLLVNGQFTTNSVSKEIQATSFPVVHIATHGEFSSNAKDTFILTWDDRINVNELDTLLRNREQRGSSAIELLVLSACKTANGDKRAALGLSGVAIRAGARSTLATIWYVSDAATAKVMGEFYKELGNSSVTKAEALRIAQEKLLKNPQYQHPYYWAPYVMVGNWL